MRLQILGFFCGFLLTTQLFSQEETIPQDKALFYEVALVKKYYLKKDWLSIIKTAKLLVFQERKDLALEVIRSAEEIIAGKRIIQGAQHLTSFYEDLNWREKSDYWKKIKDYWKKENSKKWKNF